MGMTIKKAHEIISRPLYMKNVPQEIIDAHRVAIECMRKYQNIVQIMQRTVDDGTSMYDTLQEIEEVIEDGKID